MKVQQLKQAILEMSTEERLDLMRQVGPELCRQIMQQPVLWQQMMAQCFSEANSPQMPASVRVMMQEMITRMTASTQATTQQTAAPDATTRSPDPVTRELAAIAAAVAGHCQPCFVHHYKEALALGCSPQTIQEVIELARQIRAAGDHHHDEFITRRMAGAAPPAPSGNLPPAKTQL